MSTPFLSCSEAKKIDMTNYLSSLGFLPERIIRDDYWYHSPLREEKHPSFKVNRKKNIWFDFGTGEGGTIVDFGIRYHQCSISEFLDRLKSSFSFHQPTAAQKFDAAGQKKKMRVMAATSVTNPALCRYLKDRNIPLDLAQTYCREVHYEFDEKHYYAIGFRNNSGGYELRNAHFKGCISPKEVTLISEKEKTAKEIAVFEGFFSFLSYLKMKETNLAGLPDLQGDFLILNSLSLLKKSQDIMEEYDKIHLFLDLDKAGSQATAMALKRDKRYQDERSFYQGYKDLNDMLIKLNKHQRQSNNLKHRIFECLKASGVFVLQKLSKQVFAPVGRRRKIRRNQHDMEELKQASELKKHKGGRPQNQIKRQKIICVRFTITEHFIATQKATKAGLSLSDYLRKCAINAIVKERLSEEDRHFFRQITGLSGNINQMAKLAHQEGLLSALGRFEKELTNVDELMKRFKK